MNRLSEYVFSFDHDPSDCVMSLLKQGQAYGFLTDEEVVIVKRARNYKTTSHPKSCDIVTYKYATGLESLIGYLDLENRRERIDEIMKFILGE